MCEAINFYIQDTKLPDPNQIIFSEIFFYCWDDELQKTQFTYEQVKSSIKTLEYVVTNGFFHKKEFNTQPYWHNIFIDGIFSSKKIAQLIANSSYIIKTVKMSQAIKHVLII